MPRMLTRTMSGLLVVGASLLVAGAANATVWKNYANENYCLGASGGSMTNGTNLIIWSCNGNLDQSWTDVSVGGSYVQIENNKDTSKCAGVSGGSISNGAQLIIWSCNGANDQAWEPVYAFNDANGHACYDFVNYNVEFQTEQTSVFGVSGGNLTNGAHVILWSLFTSPTHPDQYWCAY
jgi:Ricin-type beta-trefoil lectin domain-like